MIKWFLIISILFITSCSPAYVVSTSITEQGLNIKPQTEEGVNVITQIEDKTSIEYIAESPIIDQNTPCKIEGKIKNYGVPQEIIDNSMSINCQYFENIQLIEWYNTSKWELQTNHGYEIFQSNNIKIYWRDDSHINYQKLMLHELKHAWCWNNQHEMTTTHKGCFLDTPIDKEYGFIY